MAAKDEKNQAENEPEQTEGQVDPGATDNPDSAVARAAGISEGDVKALRSAANLNASAGHTANLGTWEASPAGKEFKDGEKDRVKAEKDAAKAYAEQVNDDGLSPAVVEYNEAIEKAAK